jgi:hypothetical protein
MNACLPASRRATFVRLRHRAMRGRESPLAVAPMRASAA